MSLSQIKDVAVSGVYALYYVNSWVKSWFASPSLTMEETIAQLECVREKVYQREKNLRERMEEHRSLAIEYAKKKQTREAKMQIPQIFVKYFFDPLPPPRPGGSAADLKAVSTERQNSSIMFHHQTPSRPLNFCHLRMTAPIRKRHLLRSFLAGCNRMSINYPLFLVLQDNENWSQVVF